VCRNDVLRAKVNGLLAVGTSYVMILRAIADDNTTLEKSDRVTIDSIRNHTARHFPVQNVAHATYRRLLEQRAQENGVDFVNAVATAITSMAFYETVMAEGYATLVDPDTHVDVSTAMIAAGRLQNLIESRASGTSTWRASTAPRNPRWQTRTAGLRVHGESDAPRSTASAPRAQKSPVAQSACTTAFASRSVFVGSPTVVVCSAPATLLRTIHPDLPRRAR
jgi:hypothetical protein